MSAWVLGWTGLVENATWLQGEPECWVERDGAPISLAEDKFLLAIEAAPMDHPTWADPGSGAIFELREERTPEPKGAGDGAGGK